MSSQREIKKHLVFYFQVHQPRRLKKLKFLDIGSVHDYFDDPLNEEIMNRVARECYLPTNVMLLNLIKSNPAIRVAFSISGVALQQFEQFTPEVIDSFKALAATGSVEFLAETGYHSLASMIPGDEFQAQVHEHTQKIHTLFGVTPLVFRNTELLYNDEIGRRVLSMGFQGILCEGSEYVLRNRSPYQLYHHLDGADIKLLLRSNRLSDDIAFRFHHTDEGQPLTVKKYCDWLKDIPPSERIVVLGMDYETFGEHHKTETGIRIFLKDLLTSISKENQFKLSTPSEALTAISSTDHFSTSDTISWADRDKDASAWLGNDIQLDAFRSIVALEASVKKSHNSEVLTIWRHLLTSDHFYYMSTKNSDDGNVHGYFSHYNSPYEAFINYMNVLADFALRVQAAQPDDSEASKQQEIERRTHIPPVWAEHYAASYKNEAVIGR